MNEKEIRKAPIKPNRRTKRQALQSLIDGVVNNEPPTDHSPLQVEAPVPNTGEPTAPVEADDFADTEIEALNLTEEQRATLHALRTRKVGRPKGTDVARKTPADRATFVVPRTLTQKIKLISIYEGRLYKDIIAEILHKYVADYEAENGVIKLKH